MLKKYNLMNNIFGWFCFAIAAIVYLMTIEPTASFWDCGEFITSAYKLEVGHPPGAPFFMLTGKFFTLFASDPSQVAIMVNSMSAILSALTILFLFWTITHLVKKLIYTDSSQEMTLGQTIAIVGSGLVGALTYTFTDTFWFSAVEGEVYAYSSMFTALVFWLILKWENRADQPGSDKWLVLIAYVMGLSIGVHLLNLLCIPAIGLVYYFKKVQTPNIKGTLLALATSIFLVVVLMYGVIPGFTKVGGWFELLFVNEFGLSYNIGTFFYIIILVLSMAWALFETLSANGSLKRAKIAFVICLVLSGITFIGSSALLWIVLIAAAVAFVVVYKNINFRQINTIVLCLLVILIGYSSFALIPIRSAANTPMDQNSPENVFTLANYLNREQYGDRPLFYGKTYASDVLRDDYGRALDPISSKNNYDRVIKKTETDKDRYYIASSNPTYEYDHTMLLPRMYSDENRHLMGYRMWGEVENVEVTPTFIQNMRFFFSYQLNYMYFRYFMWNFSGRQNDIQGTGTVANGNWVTGIGFIDEYILGRGPQDLQPEDITNNKGHNTYYAIPFILGLIGIGFQLTRGKKGEQQFLVTFMLFFMTGLAIIIYLNQQPFEPRERDYAYAGSFYAFCIWIGFAVAGLWKLLKKVLPETPAAAIVSVVLVLVPIQMACQNWDDHDRSGRYTMRDFGQNYLDSCEPNAILFTNGDNDTFPLWYAQEVEGYRTDVRVCNLSYLQTDWYVDQMRRQAYDSEPLPIHWDQERYSGEKGRAAMVLSRKNMEKRVAASLEQSEQKWLGYINYAQYFDTAAFKNTMPLDDALEILRTKDNYIPRNPTNIKEGVILPSSTFTMNIDTANVDWKKFGAEPQSQFTINLGDNKNAIYRQEIMIMEMLSNINKDGWKRPIYYAVTIGDYPLNLFGQLTLEGINYRITPGKINSTRVNTDLAFDNMVNKYKWGGVKNPNVYLDENTLRMCRTFRMMFARLVTALIEEGKNEKALIALDKCVEELPGSTIPRGEESIMFANAYYELGQPEKGAKIAAEILNRSERALQWYGRLSQNDMRSCSLEVREMIGMQVKVLDMYQRFDKAKFNELFPKTLNNTSIAVKNYVSFDDRDHPLDYMYYLIARSQEADANETIVEKDKQKVSIIFKLMQDYNPRLLDKYRQMSNQ